MKIVSALVVLPKKMAIGALVEVNVNEHSDVIPNSYNSLKIIFIYTNTFY